MSENKRFWETKKLNEMTPDEWESLCDACGKCCVHKIQDEDTEEIFYTDIACRLLDIHTCRCTQYEQRHTLVPECVVMNAGNRDMLEWMPSTCAYRLLAEGKPLYPWHPLLTGNPQSTHEADISVQDLLVREETVDDILDHVLEDV